MAKAFLLLLLSLLLLMKAFFPAPAGAQTPAAEAARQADVLQRQNEERIRRDIEEALPRRPELPAPSLPVPAVDASAAGPSCHQISDIVISGAPHLGPALRADINSRYAGRCLGVSEIEQILAAITKDYIDRGYITTRAYLPSQDLSRGRLEILVVEGVIGNIELDDGARRSIRPGLVFPAEGALFNLRDFEQGIEQLNRLSSNNAQLDIQPGDTPGASRVVIHNAPAFPLHAFVGVDDHGSEATGKNQLAFGLTADRLLGLNELMIYAHRRSQPYDAARKASSSDSFTFIMPAGYYTFSAAASQSGYTTSIVTPSGAPLHFQGDSDSLNLKLSRVVYRGPAGRGTLGVGLTQKSTRNYLEGEFLDISSRRLALLDLEAGFNTRLAGGALTTALDYERGLSAFGALRDPGGLPDDAPRAQFGKLRYQLGYFHPFSVAGVDAEFSTHISGQRAQNTLYGSEQILIGGIYSVRGFSVNSLSGDHGWYSRNEIALRPVLPLAGQALPLRLYAGVDVGAVSNRAADAPGGRLTGAVLGISGGWNRLTFDVFHARPLSQPDFLPHEGGQTWLRLNITI
jgi:hemolysin activation/secretion protein